jgi:hypothetical protein
VVRRAVRRRVPRETSALGHASSMAGTTTLYKPLKGKLRLQTTFMPGTRGWLNQTLGPRGFEHLHGGNWEIAATHFRRGFIAALARRFGAVVVTQEVREGRTLCTVECSQARPETADRCECVCLGMNHGCGAAGWSHAGEQLLVQSGVVALVTKVHGPG